MSEHQNPFTLNTEEYKRDINPVTHYFEQCATYLSIKTGRSYDECFSFVQSAIRNKEMFPAVKDPTIRYFLRKENGDRVQVEGSLLSYIMESVAKKDLIAPTLTTYINQDIKEALLVRYIDDNVKMRSVAKKAQFAAKARGDKFGEKLFNLEQTNRKLSNNAISGAHVSASTPLANKTAHSTLTSNCRCTSGYGNANNEKLLAGNRHYHHPQIVIFNIINIITHTDYDKLQEVINKYGLKYPSVEDAIQCVKMSTDLYWSGQKDSENIADLLNKLTDIQRAAFVYTGDFYQIMLHNSDMMYQFIYKLSRKITTSDISNSLEYVKNAHEDYLNLAHQICSEEMKGKGKDYKAMEGTAELMTLACTTKNISDVLIEYTDFIRAFCVTQNMPSSIGYLPESVRRVALTSDTDSTIFTVQDWVQWFKGDIGFDQDSMAVAATMIFLASQSITHILAMMSANFGIQKKRLYQVAMKNEFKFDVFVPTNLTKHYYAIISCQEGNVFKEHETEIKGVHLKSSNSPKAITKAASDMMEEIMMTIYSGKKISIMKYLKQIADTERQILHDIKTSLTYFRLGEIKTPTSYSSPENQSPYLYHKLWNDTFGKKYGLVGEPPYSCIKISTTLYNPTATREWLEKMEDKELAADIAREFAKYGKKELPTIMIPADIVTGTGIPTELMMIIDTRKIIYDICKIFYLILETLGFYMCNDDITKLVSDFY